MEDNRPEECPICYEQLNEESVVTKTSCNHCFHTTCLNRWFESQTRAGQVVTCPLCREECKLGPSLSFGQIFVTSLPTMARLFYEATGIDARGIEEMYDPTKVDEFFKKNWRIQQSGERRFPGMSLLVDLMLKGAKKHMENSTRTSRPF